MCQNYKKKLWNLDKDLNRRTWGCQDNNCPQIIQKYISNRTKIDQQRNRKRERAWKQANVYRNLVWYKGSIPKQQGKEWTFQYDNSNRLISANEDLYYYDAENNCICIQSDKIIKKFFYDAQNGKRPLMLTVNGVVTKFVYGLGLIGTETNDEFQTYLFDHYGNTIAVADQKQIKCFDRDVFGKYHNDTDTSLPLCLNKGYDGYIAVTDRLYFKNALFCCDMFSRSLNQNLLPPLF